MIEEFLDSGDAKPIFTDTPPVLLISHHIKSLQPLYDVDHIYHWLTDLTATSILSLPSVAVSLAFFHASVSNVNVVQLDATSGK